ncbi:ABC transporter permease [Paenibacillus algorifonticola]|uniref:FtsX-like permease family protein n=1 Tax=Paenibacillus algorifonticola TaxID=684063 RepID=UPI003D285604
MPVTFRQFAFNNVLRNKRLYAAFFFSSMFSVLVFFVYAVFAFHPALADENLQQGVSRGLHTAEAIIYIFAIFFVLYSMSSFLKSRNKEFGLLIMHGMSTFQLRLMIFLENLLIGFFSTLGGLGLGLVLAKAILMAAENLLRLDHTLPFYWPKEAMMLTFGAFMLLFAVISLFTVMLLRGKKVIELIKGATAPKSDPRASLLLSLLAALLLGSGYVGALLAKGAIVLVAFVPVTIVVIVGTYFLFTQLSVFAINTLKRNKGLFWRRTNMLTLSDLAYRMKDNARTFFIISIISTVAFTAIGTLICFGALLKRQIEAGMPFELQYTYSGPRTAQDMQSIRSYLGEQQIGYKEYEVEGGYFGAEGTVAVVPLSSYNKLAQVIGNEEHAISGDDVIVVSNVRGNLIAKPGELLRPITVEGTAITLQPELEVPEGAVPGFRPYYIVSDELYAELGKPINLFAFYLWDLDEGTDKRKAGKELKEKLLQAGHPSYSFRAKSYELDQMLRNYNIVLFIGLFIGVIFFVAAGSFLYFRLYQDLDDDKRKFAMITKLGLTSDELSRIVSRQMLLLFFAPVAVALVHGAVALTALQHMFMSSLAKEAALVLGGFLLIQLVYFLIARFYYIRSIRQAM